MVHIIHSGENLVKMNEILDIAQARFGMYGMDKTTMKEIASDLGMSKGSLYYYFPDKESLYRAVVEKEQNVFIQNIEKDLTEIELPEEMLKVYVNTRLKYFRRLLNLSRFRYDEILGIKSIMGDLMVEFQTKQVNIIENILQKGIVKGCFQIEHTNETAKLFIDLLIGLGNSILRRKNVFYLDNEEYEVLTDKTGRFTEIFIKGLK